MSTHLGSSDVTTFAAPSISPAQSQSPAPATEPYVGLRPYREAERALFFGRNQDAARLRNKILAGPVTVLYAPSGVGKTSLLVTLVIPELRAQDCLVVYFDCAPESEPIEAIATAVRAQASALTPEMSIPEKASLATLIGAVNAATGKTVVVILDQFERFLIKNASHPEPLREQLGALVASDASAHVVLSLRQEFLAALDVFRERILNLFRSTFHLLHLDADGAREAIVEPAKLFNGRCDEDLVKTLCQDLRADSSVGLDPAAIHSGGVELPFLQIVCRRLWRQSATSDRHLTLAEYEGLGRTPGIIREYIDNVVSSLPPRPRADMAKVLDYLAPRSGAKVSFAAQDLRDRTRLPEARVRAALKRLYEHWVVRERKARGTETYELYHDAFIKILRPWVDGELWRIRRGSWIRRGLVAGVVAQALVIAAIFLVRWMTDDIRTTRRVASLAADLGDTTRFGGDWTRRRDHVMRTLDDVSLELVGKSDDDALGKLEGLLRDQRDIVQNYYGLRAEPLADLRQTAESTSPVSLGGVGPNQSQPAGNDRRPQEQVVFTREGRLAGGSRGRNEADLIPAGQFAFDLRFGADPELGNDFAERVASEWRTLAFQMARSHGIPFPAHLNPIPDPLAVSGSLQVTYRAASMSMTESLAPFWGRDVTLVQVDSLVERVRNFFFAEPRDGWTPLDPRLPGGPWWSVPRWTLPIWKASRQPGHAPARLAAIALAARALENPELIVTDEAVTFLLRREHLYAPRTVEDVLLAPSGARRTRDVLLSIVRDTGSIASLSSILDAVADEPTADTKRLAAVARAVPGSSHPAPLSRARAVRAAPQVDTFTTSFAFEGLEEVFPRREQPVRLFVGDGLISRVANVSRNEVSAEVRDSVYHIGGEFFRAFGFTGPNVWFYQGNWFNDDTKLEKDSYRIEVRGQAMGDPGTQTMPGEPATLLSTVVPRVRELVLTHGAQWLTADDVGEIVGRLPARTGRWVSSRLMPGDIKRLLRAALSDDSALNARPASDTGVVSAGAEWLLTSLVFWSLVHDMSDLPQLAVALRSTREALSTPREIAAAPTAASEAVGRGITALERDDVTSALKHFRGAAGRNRGEATDAFLTLYGQRHVDRVARAIERTCAQASGGEPSAPVALSDEDLFVLEDVIRARRQAPAQRRTSLHACLFGAYVARGYQGRAGMVFDTLMALRAPAQWPSNDAYRLAYRALMLPRPDTTPVRFQQARALLSEAVRRWSDGDDGTLALGLTDLCSGKHRSAAWCRQLLDSLIRLRPRSFFFPLYVGVERSSSPGRDEVIEALSLLDSAESRVRKTQDLAPEERARYGAWIQLGRAQANLMLAQHGDRNRLAVADTQLRDILSSLQDDGGWPDRAAVTSTLMDVYTLGGRFATLDSLLRTPSVAGSRHANIMRHFVYLARGQIDSATRIADTVLAQEPYDPFSLFLSSATHLLAGRPEGEGIARRFLSDTDHEYRDYIRLMLFWAMKGGPSENSRRAADTLLRERWSAIDTTTWRDRLRDKDRSVWREMLIGYYAGHIEPGRIHGPLESLQALQASELGVLDFSLDGLRCEAYFYDALLQSVSGDAATREERVRASLKRAVDTKFQLYYEYHMSTLLHGRMSGAPTPPDQKRKAAG